jgi:hypothetical protein
MMSPMKSVFQSPEAFSMFLGVKKMRISILIYVSSSSIIIIPQTTKDKQESKMFSLNNR